MGSARALSEDKNYFQTEYRSAHLRPRTMKNQGKLKPKVGFHTNPERINSTGLNRGSEWHSTSVKRMFDNIAKAKGITAEEARDQIERIGFDNAKKFPFWRELIHYIHGKPTETKNLNFKGELSLLSDRELEDETAREISEAIGAIAGEEEKAGSE